MFSFSDAQMGEDLPAAEFTMLGLFEQPGRVIRVRRFLSFVRSISTTAFLMVSMPASGAALLVPALDEILSSSASKFPACVKNWRGSARKCRKSPHAVEPAGLGQNCH
jgi:hypothetical protein